MRTPRTWRVRLRFRLHKKLNIETNAHRLSIGGRDVVLTPPTRDQNIDDSPWLTMNARGFASQGEAQDFGRRLKSALEVSAVAARVGVDAGCNLASALGRSVRSDVLRQTGTDVRPSIHGLDVFIDDPKTRFLTMTAKGTVCVPPEPLLTDLDELHRSAAAPSERIADVVLLLNYALMQPEPAAQIVFAVSAVESLGQDETWTADQKTLLEGLAKAAEQSSMGTVDERHEVAEAIRTSLHRLSLRQGVFRLLDKLGLGVLKSPWDDLCVERSLLVYGLAPQPGADYSDLAHRTVSLCGRILLKAIAAEIPLAHCHVATLYAMGDQR